MHMKEFEYDCLLKARIARSARRRLGQRKAVTLPSDGLSALELQSRNGPCRTYRLGAPMTMAEFSAMPRDLQRAYLRRLRQRGGSEKTVETMLGVSRQELRQLLAREHVALDRPDQEAWEAFLQP